MIFTIKNWVLVLTLLLVIGESFLLLLNLVVLKRSPWTNRTNMLLALSDIFLGIVLYPAVLMHIKLLGFGILTILFLSHLYRYYQIIIHSSNPFCFNKPLIFVNHLKILLITGCIFLI